VRLVAASVALLPALAGCSSSSSVDYAADAYPSQSLVDLVKGSMDSPPPAQTAAPPAPPSSATASAAQPGPAAAPGAATARAPGAAPAPAPTVAAAPAPSAPPDNSDPVAAAYPSVSLIDLLTGSTNPAQR
jgi:hypothetical protein